MRDISKRRLQFDALRNDLVAAFMAGDTDGWGKASADLIKLLAEEKCPAKTTAKTASAPTSKRDDRAKRKRRKRPSCVGSGW